jgi:hypothetical protein
MNKSFRVEFILVKELNGGAAGITCFYLSPFLFLSFYTN